MSAAAQSVTTNAVPAGWRLAADIVRDGLLAFCEAPERKIRRDCEELAKVGEARKVAGEWWVNPDRYRPDGVNSARTLLAKLKVRPVVEGIRIGFDESMTSPKALAKVRAILTENTSFELFMAERNLSNRKTAWRVYRASRPGGRQWFRDERVPWGFNEFEQWLRVRIPSGQVEETRGAHAKPKAAIDPADLAIYEGVRLCSNQPTAASAYRTAQAMAWAEGREIPAPRTLARRFEAQFSEGDQTLARKGPEVFNRDCVPKIRDGRRREMIAGSEYELDGTKADVWRWVPCPTNGVRFVRPIIVVVADSATGCPLGWCASPTESGHATALAFIMAFNAEGAPDRVATDNGSAFKRTLKPHAFADLCEKMQSAGGVLGFETKFYKPRDPQSKGLESQFRRLKEIDRLDPLYVGNFADTKPHDLKIQLRQYVGDERFSFEFWAANDLPRAMEIWKNEPSAGCDGLTPRVAFEQRRGPKRIASPALVKLAFSVGRMETRIVARDGISFNNALYGQSQIETVRLLGKRVGVLPDATDLGVVTVVDLESGKPLYRATCERLTGKTPEQAREAHAFKRRVKRASEEAIAGRAAVLAPDTAALIAQTRAAKARAESERQAKFAGVPDDPGLVLVNPDQGAAAERVESQHQARRGTRRLSANPPVNAADALAREHSQAIDRVLRPTAQTSGGGVDVFAMLAERASLESEAAGAADIAAQDAPHDELAARAAAWMAQAG